MADETINQPTITPPAGPYPTIAASYTTPLLESPPPLLLLPPLPPIEPIICSIIPPRSNAIESLPVQAPPLPLFLPRWRAIAEVSWGKARRKLGRDTARFDAGAERDETRLAGPWWTTNAVAAALNERINAKDTSPVTGTQAGRMVLLGRER